MKPAHDYWVADSLVYVSGTTGNCSVTAGGTLCGTGGTASMLVCSGTAADPEGNSCNIAGCGLNTTAVQFFGGCSNPASAPTAGALCCR